MTYDIDFKKEIFIPCGNLTREGSAAVDYSVTAPTMLSEIIVVSQQLFLYKTYLDSYTDGVVDGYVMCLFTEC